MALVTIAGLVVAVIVGWFVYLQFRDERSAQSAQRAAALRSQASGIAAAFIPGGDGFPITDLPGGTAVTRILLVNGSRAPVYHAIVSLVLVQGAGPRTARQYPNDPLLRREFQRYLTDIPPGRSEVDLSPDWAGMSARPGIEIAFTDGNARNWLRLADGTLQQITQPAAQYYRLTPPINWLAPHQGNYHPT